MFGKNVNQDLTRQANKQSGRQAPNITDTAVGRSATEISGIVRPGWHERRATGQDLLGKSTTSEQYSSKLAEQGFKHDEQLLNKEGISKQDYQKGEEFNREQIGKFPQGRQGDFQGEMMDFQGKEGRQGDFQGEGGVVEGRELQSKSGMMEGREEGLQGNSGIMPGKLEGRQGDLQGESGITDERKGDQGKAGRMEESGMMQERQGIMEGRRQGTMEERQEGMMTGSPEGVMQHEMSQPPGLKQSSFQQEGSDLQSFEGYQGEKELQEGSKGLLPGQPGSQESQGEMPPSYIN